MISKHFRASRIQYWLISILFVGYVGQIDLLLTAPLESYIDLVADDSNYYLGVAYNLAHGSGSKFAQPLSTNGYQPLWAWLLTAVAWLTGGVKSRLVFGILTATFGLKACGIIIFGNEIRNETERACAKLALFTAMGLYKFVFSMGMETTMFVVALPLLLRCTAPQAWSVRTAWTAGLLTSLCILIRLDAVSIYVAIMLVRWAAGRLKKSDLHSLVPVVFVVSAYCLANFLAFGTPVPISGQAKALGLIIGSNFRTAATFVPTLSWAVVAWIVVTFTRRFGRGGVSFRFEIAALLVSMAMCAAYYGLFSTYAVWPWYFYGSAFVTAYALQALFSEALHSLRSVDLRHSAARFGAAARAGVATAATLVIGCASAYPVNGWAVPRHIAKQLSPQHTYSLSETFNTKNAELIQWLNVNYPKGATLAMGDRAGGLGFWMDQRYQLYQLEGLVGDREFLSHLAEGTMTRYLSQRGVDLYIVDGQEAIKSEDVEGFIEPIQVKVGNSPVNMLCFRTDDAVLVQDYHWGPNFQIRRVYDFHARVDCPRQMVSRAKALRVQASGFMKL